MTVNNLSARIVSVRFENYKALGDFHIRLRDTNILVGPNNAGKSTIVGAFRALAVALRRIKGRKPDIVAGPDGRRYGTIVPAESLPISIENIHTDYSDKDTLVTFKLSNSNELQLYFPRTGGCLLIAETHNVPVFSASAFRQQFPIEVTVVPILGPVEHKESLVQSETVQSNLATHRASRNFRNYWYHNPEHFNEFAELVKKTWDGIELEPPAVVDHQNGTLALFCKENRILRELFWIGSGFQIWCQLLTHLIRARSSSLIVIDEPEIYLHADLQRQLLGLVRDFESDVIVATHSTEIMAEAEPTDLVLIDKRKKSADRIRNVEGLQNALSIVGSLQVIALSRLARARRIVFFEGDRDYKIIRSVARKLGYQGLAAGLEIVPALSGGFGSWEKIESLSWGIEKALGETLAIGVVFDRDYLCEEELTSIEKKLSRSLSFAHIHRRKELESYLLLPKPLDLAIRSSVKDKELRDGRAIPILTTIEDDLTNLTEKYKIDVQSQLVAREVDYGKQSRSNLSWPSLHRESLSAFELKWASLDGRLSIVPAKKVLSDLRTLISDRYGVSLTDSRIVSFMRPEDVPSDFVALLGKLERFRIAAL